MVDPLLWESHSEACKRFIGAVGRIIALPLLTIVFGQSTSVLADYSVVIPSVETTSVSSTEDAADDPAIWIHPSNLELSLILGTNKQKGLEVYNLDGARVQSLDVGNLNNVDLRQEVSWGESMIDIAVATNRSTNSLSLFSIDRESGLVEHLTDQSIPLDLPTPYGVCLFRNKDSLFAFVNDKNGTFEQWELKPDGASRKARSFSVDSQPEGCVADDVTETLYYGEEEFGVWKRDAGPKPNSDAALVVSIADSALVADVEGMAIYRTDEADGYLVVSSQGDSSFAVFELDGANSYIGSFRIGDSGEKGIDGVSGTDGIAIANAHFSADFPLGILVVQDDENSNPTENQNFKLVDWRRVANKLSLEERTTRE